MLAGVVWMSVLIETTENKPLLFFS